MTGDPLREQLRRRASFLKEMGLDYGLARPGWQAGRDVPPSRPPSAVRPEGSAPTPSRRTAAAAGAVGPGSALPPDAGSRGPAAGTAEAGEALRLVRETLGDCRRCRLCERRTQIVFGVGSPSARIMFIGEGPGADEDAQGEPFVGRAGRLLTDIIQKGMGLRRADVYIANIVKCRPPENREPQPDEVEQCLPFLEGQIRAIAPEVIVGLGKTAVQALLGCPVQITKARGQWTDFKGIPLMPTFHPSYLLRNPSAKREVWLDIQEVLARLGLPVPRKP